MPEARAAGPRHRHRVAEKRTRTQPGSVGPAGIIGAGRSCTAWMISVLSIPRRYAEVIPIISSIVAFDGSPRPRRGRRWPRLDHGSSSAVLRGWLTGR
jgi:hypothetical protein